MSIEAGTLVLDPSTVKGMNDAALDDYIRDRRAKVVKEAPHEDFQETPLSKLVFGRKGKSTQAEKCEYPVERYNPMYGCIAYVYTNAAGHAQADPASKIAAGDTTAAGATVFIRPIGASKAAIQQELMSYLPLQELEIGDVARLLFIKAEVQSITHDPGTDYPYLTAKLFTEDAPVDGASILSQYSVNATNLQATMQSIAHPEYYKLGEGAYETPVWRYNMVQNHSLAMAMSGIELNRAVVYSESVKERKRQQTSNRLFRYLEWMMLNGTRINPLTDVLGFGTNAISVQSYDTYPTGSRPRTGGLEWFLNQYEPANIINIPRTSNYEGVDFINQTFDSMGYELLSLVNHKTAQFGSGTKLCICGSLALKEINDMLASMFAINREAYLEGTFGFKIKTLDGLDARWEFVRSAPMSVNPAHKRDIWVVDPSKFEWRPFKNRDLHYIRSEEDIQKLLPYGYGHAWADGIKEGWVATGTILIDGLSSMALIRGVGLPFATS